MKRWTLADDKDLENERIDKFLEEIIEVSRRHGLSLSHEDRQGKFVVQKYSQDNAEWLIGADDDTNEH